MEKLRIGVFGAGRGAGLARNFAQQGCEITALCDFNKARLEKAAEALGSGVALYEDFDSFLAHGFDAVILANFFHEHAPYAIRCLEKGIHVYSECISNGTMAEGVELVRAAEKSDAVYMLAENYPNMIFNREMQRICRGGTLGKILYAEGEYNHPGSGKNYDFMKEYNYFPEHWRNYLPRTYYITHSMGPVMRATGATPRRVTAFSVFAPGSTEYASARHNGDRVAVIMTQNDDGSIFRVTGNAAFGGHHNAYRICGTEGQIENVRGTNKVMLRYNEWNIPEGMQEINFYEPAWNDKDEELIKTSGHGGADYLTAREFVDCIREGHQPAHPFNLHAAVAMSSVGILAHRSMMAGGQPFDIPDFHREEDRKMWENDRETPFFGSDGSQPTIPCCSHPDFGPTENQLKLFREIVMEYKG